MTGRHRGQPRDSAAEDEVDEEASSRKRIMIVVGAFAVPVLLASVIAFGMREEPVREKPEAAETSERTVAPATPEGEPTYGTYVPPETEPQAATKAPKRVPAPAATPRRTTAPTPSSSPSRAARPCPSGWEDVPWLRQWCQRPPHRGR